MDLGHSELTGKRRRITRHHHIIQCTFAEGSLSRHCTERERSLDATTLSVIADDFAILR